MLPLNKKFFFVKDLHRKCKQIRSFVQSCSFLKKISLTENFIFV